MLAPMLIQLEQEIDREIARDQRAAAAANGLQDGYEDDVDDDDLGDLETEQTLKEFGPMPQIVTNDLKSLDDMVSFLTIYLYIFKEIVHIMKIQFRQNENFRIGNGRYKNCFWKEHNGPTTTPLPLCPLFN